MKCKMKTTQVNNLLLGIITLLLSAFGGMYLFDRSTTTNAINTNTDVIREFVLQNSAEHSKIEDKLADAEIHTATVDIWTSTVHKLEIVPNTLRSVNNDKRITKLENKKYEQR